MILRTTVRELFSCLRQSQGSRNSGTLGVTACPFLGEKVWSLDGRYLLSVKPGESTPWKAVCLVGNEAEVQAGTDSRVLKARLKGN